MRIGIVGSGIGGLTAAYLLVNQGHQVTLFERQPELGMSANDVEHRIAGVVIRGDVPSRMFNHRLWPRLLSLFQKIGVKVEPVNPTQSFSEIDRQVYLSLDVAYRPTQRLQAILNPKTRTILSDAKRLMNRGPLDLKQGIADDVSFSGYLADNDYSTEFKYGFLYPTLSSTVCTCSYSALERYPARIVLETLDKLTKAGESENERPLLWKTTHGTIDVVSRLARGLDDVRLSTNVVSIDRDSRRVIVRHAPAESPASESISEFDHVVIATQANTASQRIAGLAVDELEMLAKFQYETITIQVHMDTQLMPQDEKKWATFNQIVRGTGDGEPAAMCSVFMNHFHRSWPSSPPVFQTIGPIVGVDEELVLATVRLQRPVVTTESFLGWQMRKRLHAQSGRRIWFCGSYAAPGVPLLETAVESVLDLELLEDSASCAVGFPG